MIMEQVIDKTLGLLDLEQLKKYGARINRIGANFIVVDLNGEIVLRCNGNMLEQEEQLAYYQTAESTKDHMPSQFRSEAAVATKICENTLLRLYWAIHKKETSFLA